jgi:tetratricopeptide (TPR) repeat protein
MLALATTVAPAQSALEQAVTLTREKRFVEAAKAIEGAAEPAELGQRIAYHRLRAAIDSGLGENIAAANEMRAALTLAPSDSNLLLATAVAELQAGLLDDAVVHAHTAGNSPDAEALLGDIEEKRGDYAKAITSYRSAIAAAPSQERYRIDLAFQWIKHQDFLDAIDLLTKSSTLFPRSARLRTLLGIADYGEGEIQHAEAALEEAIRCDPKLNSAYECLARIALQSSAAPSEAIVHSLCSWNDLVCSALQLRTARESGNATLAKQSLARLLAAPPDSAVAACESARALDWAGQTDAARARMETCVKLDPLPQNHYRLALLYSKLGLSELARRELEIRKQLLHDMSEQSALGLSALQTFAPRTPAP